MITLTQSAKDITTNCQPVNQQQFSYNAGSFLQATAAMYNGTKTWGTGGDSQYWHDECAGMLKRSQNFFFKNNIAQEVMCEDINTCNQDMKSYKSQLLHWMMNVAKQVPDLAPQILPQLMENSKAAVSTCNCGGVKGQCGLKWTTPGNCDGTYGMGQQINALYAIQIWGIQNVAGPYNMKTTAPSDLSQGDANAGKEGDTGPNGAAAKMQHLNPITTADKAGAGILTAIFGLGFIGMGVWMLLE